MFRNKKAGTGLALLAALFSIGVSTDASALPEMIVGSRLLVGSDANVQTQSIDTAQTTADEEPDEATSDADSASN